MNIEQRTQNPDVNSPDPDSDPTRREPYGPGNGDDVERNDDIPVPPDVERPHPVEDPPVNDEVPVGDVDDSPKRIVGE